MIKHGTSCITDNWILQNVAELLRRDLDPLQSATWIACDDKTQQVINNSISWGAIAVQAFVSFLEQIVFCDQIYVLKGWTNAWIGEHEDLDHLFNCNYIKELDDATSEIAGFKDEIYNSLSRKTYVKERMLGAETAFLSNNPTFFGQVVNGCVSYLALAEHKSLAYCPHPVRAKFLEKEIYYNNVPADGFLLFENLFRDSRVNLVKKRIYDDTVITITTKMRSIALYCLLESSEDVNPIKTACQLKNDNDFRLFRAMLHELQVSHSENNKLYIKRCAELGKTIEYVEKKLGLKRMSDYDGLSQVNIMGLPVKVPSKLRFPIFKPKHSTIVYKLLCSQAKDIKGALKKCFGINHPSIIEDMIKFNV